MPPKKEEKAPSMDARPSVAESLADHSASEKFAYDLNNDKFLKMVLEQFVAVDVDPTVTVPQLLSKALHLHDVATELHSSLLVDFLFEDFVFCSQHKFSEERAKSFVQLMMRIRDSVLNGDGDGAQLHLADALGDSALRCVESHHRRQLEMTRAQTPIEAVVTEEAKPKPGGKKAPEAKPKAQPNKASEDAPPQPVAPPPVSVSPSWFEPSHIPFIVEYVKKGILHHKMLYRAVGLMPKQADPIEPPVQYFAIIETVCSAPKLNSGKTEDAHKKLQEQLKEEGESKIKKLRETELAQISQEQAALEQARREEEEREREKALNTMQQAAMSNKGVEEAVQNVMSDLDHKDSQRRKDLLARLEKIEDTLKAL